MQPQATQSHSAARSTKRAATAVRESGRDETKAVNCYNDRIIQLSTWDELRRRQDTGTPPQDVFSALSKFTSVLRDSVFRASFLAQRLHDSYPRIQNFPAFKRDCLAARALLRVALDSFPAALETDSPARK